MCYGQEACSGIKRPKKNPQENKSNLNQPATAEYFLRNSLRDLFFIFFFVIEGFFKII